MLTQENLNSLIYSKEIENVSERKLQTQMASLMNSIELHKIILQKPSGNRGDRNTSQLTLCDQYHPDTEPEKDITKKHTKFLNTVLANQIQQYLNRKIH